MGIAVALYSPDLNTLYHNQNQIREYLLEKVCSSLRVEFMLMRAEAFGSLQLPNN